MKQLELKQTHPQNGSREFTLDAEEIHFTISSPLRNDSLTVPLHVLDAKPLVNDSTLEFVSQINKEPLVELFVDSPDKSSFDQFIEALKQRIADEDFSRFRVAEDGVKVDPARLGESIRMLKQYVDLNEIESLLAALFALQANPNDVVCQRNVADTFNALGIMQGQVLTYAPYLNNLLFGNE